MGRYPFVSEVREYLDAQKPYYDPGTLRRMARNLRVTFEDLRALQTEGKVSTLSPSRLKEDDIGALLYFWQNRGRRGKRHPNGDGRLDLASQRRYLSDLQGFLEWKGNPVISVMKRKRLRLPRALEKPIRTLSREELERLRQAAERIPGWSGVVARFMVAFFPASGLRRKELRLAHLEDLDAKRWRILVRHPKGEGSWAAPDYAPVLGEESRQATLDFLQERAEWLRLLGLNPEDVEPLVPQIHQWTGGNPREARGPVTFYSDGMFRKVKDFLERTSGIKFPLGVFRATFAQMAIDGGARLDAVARALRHRRTSTTEQYYARIRSDDAFSELERAFSKPVARVQSDPKTPD